MRQNSLLNSTPLRLDDQWYKSEPITVTKSPISLSGPLVEHKTKSLRCLYPSISNNDMSRPSTPIFVSSCSSSPSPSLSSSSKNAAMTRIRV